MEQSQDSLDIEAVEAIEEFMDKENKNDSVGGVIEDLIDAVDKINVADKTDLTDEFVDAKETLLTEVHDSEPIRVVEQMEPAVTVSADADGMTLTEVSNLEQNTSPGTHEKNEEENSRTGTSVECDASSATALSTSERAANEAMKQILAQYKALALETGNHSVLMKDSASLMMIVFSLGNDASDVVSEGLAIIHLLGQKVDNRRALFNTLHMMDALAKVVEEKLHSEEIIAYAELIHDMLMRASKITQSKQEKAKGKGKSARAKVQDVKRKINSSMSRSKPVYLYIPYNIFFKEKRNTITQTLQQDKDVLSITFDMNKCLCVLRVKNHALPETFGKVVANLGFECYLIALNDKNEEVKIPMEGDSKLGKDVYEYLSESDEENNKSLEEKALATAEDVKRKKEKQGKGLLASVKSFFW